MKCCCHFLTFCEHFDSKFRADFTSISLQILHRFQPQLLQRTFCQKNQVKFLSGFCQVVHSTSNLVWLVWWNFKFLVHCTPSSILHTTWTAKFESGRMEWREMMPIRFWYIKTSIKIDLKIKKPNSIKLRWSWAYCIRECVFMSKKVNKLRNLCKPTN